MPVRKVIANDKVTNDAGKVALQRGPLVYCFEDKDNNDGWMFDNMLSTTAKVESTFEKNLLGGVVILSLEGSKIMKSGDTKNMEATILKTKGIRIKAQQQEVFLPEFWSGKLNRKWYSGSLDSLS